MRTDLLARIEQSEVGAKAIWRASQSKLVSEPMRRSRVRGFLSSLRRTSTACCKRKSITAVAASRLDTLFRYSIETLLRRLLKERIGC